MLISHPLRPHPHFHPSPSSSFSSHLPHLHPSLLILTDSTVSFAGNDPKCQWRPRHSCGILFRHSPSHRRSRRPSSPQCESPCPSPYLVQWQCVRWEGLGEHSAHTDDSWDPWKVGCFGIGFNSVPHHWYDVCLCVCVYVSMNVCHPALSGEQEDADYLPDHLPRNWSHRPPQIRQRLRRLPRQSRAQISLRQRLNKWRSSLPRYWFK